MKKSILSICALAALPFVGLGQQKGSDSIIPVYPESPRVENPRNEVTESVSRARGAAIWQENFQNGVNSGTNVITSVGTWTTSGVDGNVWKHSLYQTSGCWSDGTPLPPFTTVSNGFLLFDADSANCQNPNTNPPTFTQDELTGHVESPTINLSGHNAVILEFEYENRWCCTEAVLSVDISTDNGLSYPTSLSIPVNIVNEGQTGLFSQNISAFAGGQSQVKLRFSWNGVGSHYYLAIDDIAIKQAATDDLKLQWDFVSHNGTVEEYSRFSMNQAQNTIQFGASIENFGSSIASNSTLFVSVEDVNGSPVYVGSASESILLAGDTTFLSVEANVNFLPGLYTAYFTVTSDGEQSGSPNFGDNTGSRVFEVSNEVYCIDGIGVHPVGELDLAQISTASFTDGEDGLMIFSHNDINASVTVYGVQVELSAVSAAGGLIVAALHDSADVFDDLVYNELASSAAYAITANDLTTGIVDIPFTAPVWVGPGQYYAGVELFSNGNTNDVGILDDLTIPQPFWSSMIYIPNDQVYSNGNAMAVRLLTDMVTDVQETEVDLDFGVFPNPAIDELRIRSSADGNVTVRSLEGKVVQQFNVVAGTQQIHIENLSAGIYNVELLSERGRIVKKIVVNK